MEEEERSKTETKNEQIKTREIKNEEKQESTMSRGDPAMKREMKKGNERSKSCPERKDKNQQHDKWETDIEKRMKQEASGGQKQREKEKTGNKN